MKFKILVLIDSEAELHEFAMKMRGTTQVLLPTPTPTPAPEPIIEVKTTDTIACAICQTPFVPKTVKSVTCSNACYQKMWHRKNLRKKLGEISKKDPKPSKRPEFTRTIWNPPAYRSAGTKV